MPTSTVEWELHMHVLNIRAAWASSAGSLIMAIVMLTLSILIFQHLANNGPTVIVAGPASNCTLNRTLSTELCPTSSECKLGYYTAELDACMQAAAPTGTPCTNVCYESDAESTVCSGDGLCTGDPADCRGRCTTNASCATAIPFDLDWLTTFTFHADVPYVLDYQVTCTFGQCGLHTLDWYWQQYEFGIGEPASAMVSCKDFLAASFPTERLACLEIESFLLDTNITDAIENNTVVTLPNQFRMCSFRYKCAPFVYDKKKKRDVDQLPSFTAAKMLQGAEKRVHHSAKPGHLRRKD